MILLFQIVFLSLPHVYSFGKIRKHFYSFSPIGQGFLFPSLPNDKPTLEGRTDFFNLAFWENMVFSPILSKEFHTKILNKTEVAFFSGAKIVLALCKLTSKRLEGFLKIALTCKKLNCSLIRIIKEDRKNEDRQPAMVNVLKYNYCKSKNYNSRIKSFYVF